MINLIRRETVTPTESHFEIEINGKVVQFAKWVDYDWHTSWEIFKGEDYLTDEEYEDVYEYIDEQEI